MKTDPRVLWIYAGGPDPAEQQLHTQLTGFHIISVEGVPGALSRLRDCTDEEYDALVASLPIPDWSAAGILEEVQRLQPDLPVLLRDPGAALEDALRAAKLGAHHFSITGLDAEGWLEQLESAVQERRRRERVAGLHPSGDDPWKRFLIGESRPMLELNQIIRLVGPRRSTVLITGETGTGKEMAARAIHLASPRAHLPMVAFNCSALPEHLLESELFGHVKGAFTGAAGHRTGRFEQAHKSTVFLDEIGDLPLSLQAKLLRVLQEREFQRLGSSETIKVDLRVIAASNLDLQESVRLGKFREDLFYRLNVVPVHMPSLTDRASDIPMLVDYFLEKICRQEELTPKQVSREALDRLRYSQWPGNVRQLENAVERAVAVSGARPVLYPSDFARSAAAEKVIAINQGSAMSLPEAGLDFQKEVDEFERAMLTQAMRRANGNKTLAADFLRLKRTTLLAKLRSLNVSFEQLAARSA
jgi:DNA-binding NtrC family response regulator